MDEEKKSGCLLRWVFWILLIAAVICYSLVHRAVTSLQYEATGLRYMVNQEQVYTDEAVRNILIIGTDARTEDGAGRSDAMLLISISEHNKTITVTSLMRDCYVEIPNHGRNRLNAAYSYGGATLLMDTIESNFHIDVNEYFIIDFYAFIAMVDALGGVELTVTDAEAEGMNDILAAELNTLLGDDREADFLESGGTMVLSGKQALAYSRLRYVGNADYERTERQREVLTAVMQRAASFNPVGWFKLVEEAMPLVVTNIEQKSLVGMAFEMPFLAARYETQTLRIPASGTYSNETTSAGASVLRVDFDENLTIFKDAVQNPIEASEDGEDNAS